MIKIEEAKKILIIDDEKPIVEIVKFNLEKENYLVDFAFNSDSGIQKALEFLPDLIILDVMIPKISGFEVCQKLSDKLPATSIIMLTAKSEESDKILGFERGASDYITKPFSIKELMMRVKVNIRKNCLVSQNDKNIKIKDIMLDIDRNEIHKSGIVICFTVREFELIRFLAKYPNKIFSRQTLLKKVWEYEHYGDLRTVDVAIRRIREKLEDDPREPKYIITKRTLGYYFSS